MTQRGGKREGAGRPKKYLESGNRVNIYLPAFQLQYLERERNMSAKIQQYINNEMEEKAHDRINELGFTSEQQSFIFADWSNHDEHISWLLTATKSEIEDWGIAGNWGVEEKEEY